MKRYGLRLALANALIVVSALAIVSRLLGWIVPETNASGLWLLPALMILACLCALAFAIVEAIFLYRDWRASAAGEKSEQPPPPAA